MNAGLFGVRWLDGTERATCPICGGTAPKRRVLDMVVPITEQRVELLRCSDCASCFVPSLSPANYEGASPTALKFYLEQGAGVDGMLTPIYQVEHAGVRSYLEIGCGFGFSLDFARSALGWRVRGIDPSWLAAAGKTALDLPIESAYLTTETDLGDERFDLILCSEVIEHVPDAPAFARVLRKLVAANGTLVLTTPDGAKVVPETPAGALMPLLSPGAHNVLFSGGALERILREAGFAHVHVEPHDYTLHAFASSRPVEVGAGQIDRPLYRRWLAQRAEEVEPGTPLAHGLNYRLLKDAVNASDFDFADIAFARLADSYKAVCGVDIREPGELFLDPQPTFHFDELAPRYPFSLGNVLYFRAMALLNGKDDRIQALQYFRAAARTNKVIRIALASIKVDDGETEHLGNRSQLQACKLLAGFNLPAGLAELDRLTRDAASDDPVAQMVRMPMEMLDRFCVQLLPNVVNAGNYAGAESLADRAAAVLGVARSPLPPAAQSGLGGDEDLSALWALGILSLNHRADYPRAVDLFQLLHELCRRECRSADGCGSAAMLIWEARMCAAMALKQDHDDEAARSYARALVEPPPQGLPPIPEPLANRAQELLAALGEKPKAAAAR